MRLLYTLTSGIAMGLLTACSLLFTPSVAGDTNDGGVEAADAASCDSGCEGDLVCGADNLCACPAGRMPDPSTTGLCLVGFEGDGTRPRPFTWSDGSFGHSCQDYATPPPGYEGTTIDAFYFISPADDGRRTVLCDMDDAIGWTGLDPTIALAFPGDSVGGDGCGNTPFVTGSSASIVVCSYDVELGFDFNQIRIESSSEPVIAAPTGDVDIAYLADSIEGVYDIVNGRSHCDGTFRGGGVFVGSKASTKGSEVIDLGDELGAQGCQTLTHFTISDSVNWPVSSTSTAKDSFLRLRLAHYGDSDDVNLEWASGFFFVSLIE